MKKLTPKKYAVSLYEALEESPGRSREILDRFVELLVRNNDLAKADAVIRTLDRYMKEQEGVLDVHVVTSRPLHENMKKYIVEYLNKQLRKQIILSEEIEREVIGGIIIRYNDTVIDGSVRKKLTLLREQFA